MAGNAWSQGRPPNQAQQSVQVGNAFANVRPETAQAGAALTLSFAFRAGVQAPPGQVTPTEAILGETISQSIVRDGSQFTAVFDLGSDVPTGPAALAVSFPGPNGTVTFEQAGAVSIDVPSAVAEEEPDSAPEPVLIAEAPEPGDSEPATNAETGLANLPTTVTMIRFGRIRIPSQNRTWSLECPRTQVPRRIRVPLRWDPLGFQSMGFRFSISMLDRTTSL